MKKLHLILYVFLIIVLSSFASATLYTFQPDGTNKTDVGLWVLEAQQGGGTYLLIGIHSPETKTYRGLFNYSLVCDTIPDGEEITSVIWQLRSSAFGNEGDNDSFNIYPVNESWDEDIVNWSNYGNGSSSKYNTTWNLTVSAPTSWEADTYYNITINATYFDRLCQGKMGAFDKGFILINEKAETGSGILRYTFYTADETTVEYRPKLYINTLPGEMSVTLDSPANNFAETPETPIEFSCTADAPDELTNMKLWLNTSGAWEANETKALTGITDTATFTKTISSEGTYTWNCEAFNSTSGSVFATSNRTFYIDAGAPSFTNYSTNITYPLPTDTLQLNATIIEAHPSHYRLTWNATGTWVNQSVQSVPADKILTTTKYINESWTAKYICWKYWANDSVGFTNVSDINCFTITPILYNITKGIGEYPGIATLNITFWDEETLNRITDNVDLDNVFDVWYEKTGQTWNYSFGFTNNDFYALGIFPNSTSVQVDALFDYSLAGYETRNYYLNNATLNNITKELNLYFLSEGNATKITFYVYRQIGNQPIGNAYLKAQRYYPATDTYKTIEIGKTDDNGIVAMQLVLDTVLYRFVVEKDDIVLKTTSRNKITSTTIYIYVQTEEDFLQTYDMVQDITYSLTWNNLTSTWTYIYSDTSNIVREGCLVITKRTAAGEIELSRQCETSTSATISYTFTDTIIGDYMAYAYIDSTTEYSMYPLATDELLRYLSTDIFGEYGTYLYIGFLGTVAFAGIFNPIAAIIMVLLGFGTGVALGFIDVPYITLTLLCFIGGILIYKIRT